MIDHLRQNFAQVFGRDFEILESSLRLRDSATLWVVAVRPRRSGTFFFRHQYQQAEGYRHHDDESRIVVLEKGTPRRLRYDLNPQTIGVGDTLLVPFAAGPNTADHRFLKESRFPQYFDGPFGIGLDASPLANLQSAPVQYLGRELFHAVYRVPQRAFLAFHAYFEATQPGRANLHLRAKLPAEFIREHEGQLEDPAVLSVLVSPPEVPITVLLASVSTLAFDKPEAVSTGWASFPTTLVSIRPGDRFSVTYGWMNVANTPQTRAQASQVTPLVSAQPFAVDAAHQCNAWLVPTPNSH